MQPVRAQVGIQPALQPWRGAVRTLPFALVGEPTRKEISQKIPLYRLECSSFEELDSVTSEHAILKAAAPEPLTVTGPSIRLPVCSPLLRRPKKTSRKRRPPKISNLLYKWIVRLGRPCGDVPADATSDATSLVQIETPPAKPTFSPMNI